MNLFSIFIISFTIALSGALMPGPLMTSIIAHSPRHGFKTGPLFILGHAILELFMIALIVLGLSRFIENESILRWIAIAGAIILIFFGINMIRSLKGLKLSLKSKQMSSSSLVFMGITMSAVNPFWTIWWLTIGLGFVLAAKKAGLLAIGVFFSGHILADFGWYSAVSFMISAGKRFISDRMYKGLIAVCAVVLIGFGIYFLRTSF
jgi:threonine/homoserine/homoserine lactone efflux protein